MTTKQPSLIIPVIHFTVLGLCTETVETVPEVEVVPVVYAVGLNESIQLIL